MYLAPADLYHQRDKRRNVTLKRSPYDEWVKMRHKLREADICGKSRTKAILEFLRRVMLTPPEPPAQQQQQLAVSKVEVETSPPPPTCAEISDDEDTVSVPYSMPSFLDTQYGIRKDGDIFTIGDTPVYVDTDGDIKINNKQFKGTEGLWELLTRKHVNMERVSKTDLKTYKEILVETNAHLTGYQPDDTINITRGKKFAMSLRPCLRTQRDAKSNRRCGVGGKSIDGQTVLRPRQTVVILDVAEAAAGGGGREEVCPGVVRATGCIYDAQAREKAVPS
jgi:hypothetical protein